MKVNPPPVIKEEDSIDLQVGSSLSHQLKVEGGTPPYTWTLAEGLLPDGVRLEKHGHIAGAASQAEEAPVTLVVEDRWAARSTKEVTLSFKAQDPNQEQNQDQNEDDKQEQEKSPEEQEQDQQDQQQADNQDPQNQEQNGDEQQEGQDQQEQADAGEQGDENQDAQEQQEAQIKQADIQRWLDDLPEESKEALLMQMLNGKNSDKQVENPW